VDDEDFEQRDWLAVDADAPGPSPTARRTR
jgi:hypothetical protein